MIIIIKRPEKRAERNGGGLTLNERTGGGGSLNGRDATAAGGNPKSSIPAAVTSEPGFRMLR